MDQYSCLGIPIDHRLREKIASVADGDVEQVSGTHVDIFSLFARSRKVEFNERRFGEKLASPSSRGGLLIVLAQPAPSQKYQSNFEATTCLCPTLQATDELLKATSNQSKDLFNTSTFDILPLVKKDWKKHSNGVGLESIEAQETFLSMVHQKNPSVILCLSGKLDDLLPRARRYKGLGVGVKFGTQNEAHSGEATRINVFHPSYSVNYQSVHSVLRDLLILEFTHAFGVLRGNWIQEPWMDDLRKEAKEMAAKRDVGFLQHALDRLGQLRGFLTEKNFFNLLKGAPSFSQTTYEHIINNGLRRICCDISLVFWWLCETLERNRLTVGEKTLKRNLEQELVNLLKCGIQSIWNGDDVPKNRRPSTKGVFILPPQPTQPKNGYLIVAIRQCFRKFFQQLNDSFIAAEATKENDTLKFKWDLSQQKFAFETLSTKLENTLAKWISKPRPTVVYLAPSKPKTHPPSSKPGVANCPQDVDSPELIESFAGLRV